jgi:lysophospholipase L1-like esterase
MDIIIEEEIKKNGNTNFITDSGFESGQQIFAIGDSHSIFFYNSMKIKEHWFGACDLPITIYKLLNNTLNIYETGNYIGNGHQLYNIKSNDFVVMHFGSNDIQRNINLHSANRWKEEIEYLINMYIKTILNLKQQYNIIPVVSCIYPNTRPGAQGHNSMGSLEERQEYTLYANSILKILCEKEQISYLDIYNFITDENGLIKESFTTDKIHLDYNNKFLRDFIDGKIIDLCKK